MKSRFATALISSFFAFAGPALAVIVAANSAYVIPRATVNAGDSHSPAATLCTSPRGEYSLRVIPNVAEPVISPVPLLGGGLRLQVGLFTPREGTRENDCNNNGIPDECEINQLAWSLRTPSGAAPSPRAYHAMAFDAARGQTVLFGGYHGSGIFDGETWTWDGTAWTQKAIGGPAPSPRCCHAMAYDADRQVVVLFGGQTGDAQFSAETWEWNGIAWSQRAVGDPGPIARFEHRMAYDSARHVTMLFGGYDITINPFGDTWTWNGTAWTLADAGGAGRPAPRAQHALAYDSTRQVTVLFGGSTTTPVGATFGDTWEWNGSTWVERSVIGPRARKIHTMSYDSSRNVSVLFGGHLAPGFEPPHNGETWEWNGTSWTQQPIAGPAPRYNHAMAFDAIRLKTVLFGGDVSGAPFDGQTWELGLIGDCNNNGIPDDCDIASGTSLDCQPNGIPDECELQDRVQQLVPFQFESLDNFGGRIAVSGDTLLIGATHDDSVNGADCGAVYEFRRNGAHWSLNAELASQYLDVGDLGGEVAIDGDIAMIGAPGDDTYGNSAGSVLVLNRGPNGTWSFVQTLYAGDPEVGDGFGEYIAISGNSAVVGARQCISPECPSVGKAYVFERNPQTNTWSQVQKLVAEPPGGRGDSFGHTVAIDGDTIVVGEINGPAGGFPDAGTAYVYERNQGGQNPWGRVAKLDSSAPSDGAAFSARIAIAGGVIAIGAPYGDFADTDAGEVYVFERPLTGWVDTNVSVRIVAVPPQAGASFGVGLALQANRLAVGAQCDNQAGPCFGSVSVFERNAGPWQYQCKQFGSGVQPYQLMGTPIAMDERQIFVGNNGPHSYRAPVYVFDADCIPDECEPPPVDDCNNNGIPDAVEIANCAPGDPSCTDCDTNGRPDVCDASAPPVIEQQPRIIQRICATGRAEIVVDAGPAGQPACYQWQRFVGGGWINLPCGGRFSGCNSNTLVIDELELADAGLYRVRVINPLGSVTSDSSELFVGQSVVIFQQPAPITDGCVGSRDRLLCVDATGQPPLTYRWWHRPIGGAQFQLLAGATNQCLQFNPLRRGDAGEYYVDVTGVDCTLQSDTVAIVVVPRFGDMNCDGVVNNFDIDPFVLAIVDPTHYNELYPDCFHRAADVDNDGVVTNFDIDPFVECLLNAGCGCRE